MENKPLATGWIKSQRDMLQGTSPNCLRVVAISQCLQTTCLWLGDMCNCFANKNDRSRILGCCMLNLWTTGHCSYLQSFTPCSLWMEQLTKSYQNLMLYTIFEYGDFKKTTGVAAKLKIKIKNFKGILYPKKQSFLVFKQTVCLFTRTLHATHRSRVTRWKM